MKVATRLVLLAVVACALSSCARGGQEALGGPAGVRGRRLRRLPHAGRRRRGREGRPGPRPACGRPSAASCARSSAAGAGCRRSRSKLSEPEILAVAQYVDGVAGRGAQQAAAFKPDGTTAGDVPDQADPGVLRAGAGQPRDLRGARAGAGDARGARSQTPTRVHLPPHRAHDGRRGARPLQGRRGRRAFIDGSPICASGYYHGVLERAFTGARGRRARRARRASCARTPSCVAAPFLQFQCLHGLGHGLMIYTVYDLPLGSEDVRRAAGRLRPDLVRRRRVHGERRHLLRHAVGVAAQKDDLIYPCNAVDERHKYHCYRLVTARILPGQADWEEGARRVPRERAALGRGLLPVDGPRRVRRGRPRPAQGAAHLPRGRGCRDRVRLRRRARDRQRRRGAPNAPGGSAPSPRAASRRAASAASAACWRRCTRTIRACAAHAARRARAAYDDCLSGAGRESAWRRRPG